MSSKSVVIVGCDVSGLSCASYLHKNGFSDVILLEAKERIGGRVSTVRKEGFLQLFFLFHKYK